MGLALKCKAGQGADLCDGDTELARLRVDERGKLLVEVLANVQFEVAVRRNSGRSWTMVIDAPQSVRIWRVP